MLKIAKITSIFFVILVFFILGISKVQAIEYDLKIGSADIYYSEDVLIAGSQIRIYAKVHNIGTKDMVGYVSFFSGIELIGNSQSVSVLPGTNDDVFVDFTVPDSSFNILAKIQGAEPADQNSSNDETQSPLITPEHDTDGDGIVDSQDTDDDNDGLLDNQENENSCPYRLQADSDNDGVNDGNDVFPCNSSESVDTDGDGIGNNADVDDDNDGWSDAQDLSHGTDPLRTDTDGDGVNDPQDLYPLDPSKSKEERNIFQPPVPVENLEPDVTPSDSLTENNEDPNLLELTNEIQNIIESPLESNEGVVENLEELKAVVTKSAGTQESFFRLGNWFMWLIFVIILVGIATVLVFIFLKDKSFSFPSLPKISLPQKKPKPPKPAKVQKSELTPDLVKQAQPSIQSQPGPRPSNHVIDLKKLNKK